MHHATALDRFMEADKAKQLVIVVAIGLWVFCLLFQAMLNGEFVYRISNGDALFIATEVVVNLGLLSGLHHVFLARGLERIMAIPLFILCLWVFIDRLSFAGLYWRLTQ